MTQSLIQGLYAIVPADDLPHTQFMNHCEAVMLGGAVMVQYRAKTMPRNQQYKQAAALLSLCREYRVPMLINDDLALAIELGAPGVHLGQNDGSVADARSQLGSTAIIGVTCGNSLDAAVAAQEAGASYVSFGALHPSTTKPEATPCAHEVITSASERLSIPIVAVGGLTPDNAGEAVRAGADLIAVSGALFRSSNPQQIARRFTALFSTAEEPA